MNRLLFVFIFLFLFILYISVLICIIRSRNSINKFSNIEYVKKNIIEKNIEFIELNLKNKNIDDASKAVNIVLLLDCSNETALFYKKLLE